MVFQSCQVSWRHGVLKNKNLAGSSVRRSNVIEDYIATYHAMVVAAFLSTGIQGLLKFPKSTYMHQLGISLSVYGVLISIGYVLQFVTNGLIGNISDRSGEKRLFLIASIGLDFVMHVVFLISKNIYVLSVAFVLQSLCSGVFRSINYAIISNISVEDKEGKNFAVFNVGGSIGWMLFSLVNGVLLTLLGYKALFLCGILLSGIKFLIVVLYIKNPVITTDKDVKEEGIYLFRGIEKSVVIRIIGLYALYLLTNLNHMGGFSYMQFYFNSELNITVLVGSIVLASSGFFEIPLSLITGKLISKLETTTVIIIGCVLGSFRWLVLTFAQGPGLLFLVQLMHATMVCIISVAMTTYLSRIVPQNLKGTAYGLFNSMGAVGCMFGPIIIGILSDNFGIKTAMRVNGVFGMVGIVIFVLMNFASEKIG
jgi:MFS family permease